MPQPRKTADPLTVKELATKLDTDPRALRGFLRRTGQSAGKGARYAFDAAAVKTITKAWTTDQAVIAAGAAEETTDAAAE